MSFSIPELEILSWRDQFRASLTAWVPWVGKGSLAILDQGLISGSNFLVSILLARWLAPDAYGAYALAFSIFLFLSGFHNALILEPMSVFGPAFYRDRLPAYLGKLLRLHFALTVALAVLLALGATCLMGFFANPAVPHALFGVVLAAPWVLFLWLSRRAAYIELRSALSVRGAAAYCLLVLLFLFLVQRLGWLSPFVAFLLQALASLAGGTLLLGSLWPRLRSIGSSPPMRRIMRQHWKYGRWVAATTLVAWLSGNAYYLLVGVVLRMQDVAALRALQNFVLPITQFTTAISLLLLPWASAQFIEQGGAVLRKNIRKITWLFVSGTTVYLLCILLFGHWLMETLYAGRYLQVEYLLPLAGVPLLLGAAAQGPGVALAAMQTPSKVFLGNAAAAAATVVVGVPLTYYRGLVGAMVAMVISSSAFFVVIIYCYRTSLRRVADVA